MHTGITFAYRSALLKGKSMASVKFNGTIEQLLIKLTAPFDLCYSERTTQVILHTACRPNRYTISGFIIENENQKAIPYVSVTTTDYATGVIADHEGYFELALDYTTTEDTLIFSCMGYQRDTIYVSPRENEPFYVRLSPRVYKINPAVISPDMYEIRKLGNNKSRPVGSLYLDTHGQQAALFIENNKNQIGIIQAVEYYISRKGNTNAPFRVRIYQPDSAGLPGKELTQDAIVVKPDLSEGWYRIDLVLEDIEFPKQGAFVAIEGVFPDDYDYYHGSADFVDIKATKQPLQNENLLAYGQRLGYNRKGRKDTWHYSMSKIWFQLEKQAFGVMISATVKYVKNTDNNDQENE